MIIELEREEQLKEIIEKYDNVVVDFYAKWCSPCRYMLSVIGEIEEDSDVVFVKVNTDDLEQLSASYEVYSIPSFIAFKSGERIFFEVDDEKEEMLVGKFDKKIFKDILADTFKL